MLIVVVDRLLSYDGVAGLAQRLARILVPVIFRKGTGGDFQANTVSLFELLAGIPEIDIEWINLSRGYQRGLVSSVAISRSHNSIAQPLSESVRPHIEHLSRKVGVLRGRAGKELYPNRPTYVHIF